MPALMRQSMPRDLGRLKSKSRPANRNRGGRQGRRQGLNRRLLGSALALSAVALLALAGYWLVRHDYPGRAVAWNEEQFDKAIEGAGLSIVDVVVQGRHETSRRDLARALAAPKGGSIIAFDNKAAQRRIEALGWVARAAVARRLPHTIAVTLVERRPFAIWRRGRRHSLIDREGVVIGDRIAKRYADLLVLEGRQAPAQAGALVDLLARQPALYARVVAARRQGGRRWDVRLQNGVWVRLPEDDGAQAWARLAVLEHEHRILSRQLQVIDLRLPDRLIVRLTPGAAARRRHPGKST